MHRIEILGNQVRYNLSEEDARADDHEQSTIPGSQCMQRIELMNTLVQRGHEGEALDGDLMLETRFSRRYLSMLDARVNLREGPEDDSQERHKETIESMLDYM